MNGPSTSEALAAFAAVVGDEHLDTSPTALRAAETATFATGRRVPAIVSPGSRAEVEGCVRVAARHRVPVYPVSRGKNWGYGSRVPTADGSVILSLHRLDEIVDYDEALAYVTVQPGVTFRLLREFLAARGSALHLNAPGSTAEASVVGNTVERGIVRGVQPDKSRDVSGLEVVLADGRCVRTGMGALAGSRTAPMQQWGIGPALDGLFLQSNLGIVTEMTLWLEPLPAVWRHFHFLVPPAADPGPAWEALRRLRRDGTVTTSISMHNALKVMSLHGRYPYAATRGRTPLPQPAVDAFVEKMGGHWFGEAAIHGATADLVAALQERVETVLGPAAAGLEFGDLNAPGPAFGAAGGDGIAGAYWRKRTPPPADPDPDRDGCGVIWHAPAVPFDPQAVAECERIATPILSRHGFEPLLTFTAVSLRCVYAIISIVYDRDAAGEDERALDCHRELASELSGAGLHPYRLGLPGMDDPPARDPAYRDLLRTLKRALDPHGILAPGRYDLR